MELRYIYAALRYRCIELESTLQLFVDSEPVVVVVVVVVVVAEKSGLPVKEFLEKINQERSTPLHAAIGGGDLKAVKTFMSYGSAIDVTQEDGSTAVHLAAAQGATDMIRLMFEMQPEKKITCLKSRDLLGLTPLHRAALMDRNQTVGYLLDEGSEIDERTVDGRTALLMAASRRAWSTTRTLINAGADITLRDPENRNIAHLTIRGGGQLEKLEICLCKESMRQLLDEQDNFGCTPLHYACSQGHLKTVAKLLLLGSNPCTKTDQKQSALHFAARTGHYDTCQLLIEYTPLGNNLINEVDGQGQTPLHAAAEEGHVKVVKLLLKKGAAAVKDIDGNNPLHLAAKNGFVDTMAAILETHGALLNNLNKNHDSCLHVSAREGHANAVTLLLTKGCKMNLNKDELYSLDLAIANGHQEVCMAIITHDRWKEALDNKSTLYGCPMVGLIKHMPEVCQIVLDRSQIPSGPDPKAPGFHYIYDFKYLQIRHELLWNLKRNGFNVLPLFAMNMMVKFKRVKCLKHRVCGKFLNMKWEAYGRWCHLMNLFFYLVFLFSLSGFILSRQYCRAQERRLLLHYDFNETVNIMHMGLCSTHLKVNSTTWFVLLVVLMVSICLNSVKNVIKLMQEGLSYFTYITNLLECILYVSSAVFAGSFLLHLEPKYQWTCGTIAIFLAWFNLLLFLQRFEYFGIHIVMFLEILKTLVKVITVFFVLIIAFGIVFMILQTNGNSISFSSPELSLMSTGLMMLGAIDYIETWANPFSRGELPHPGLNFLMLAVFILFMPILLINLLIGLAVGDIDSVRKNACLKRLAMQVQLYTELEDRLPRRLLKFVDKPFVKVYLSNPPSTPWQRLCHRMKKKYMKKEVVTDGTDIGDITYNGQSSDSDTNIYKELCKQKMRMKQISLALEKQQSMLRLLLQKSGVDEEADDYEEEELCGGDESDTPAQADSNQQGPSLGAKGWPSRALRHTLLKQANVIAKWKQKEDG